MTWDDIKYSARVERDQRERQEKIAAAQQAESEGTRRTRSAAAENMKGSFSYAVAEFLRSMPRSAAEKGRPGWRSKRFFYLRDTEAETEQFGIRPPSERIRYIGAHVFLNGYVVTYGMGLEQGEDAAVSDTAMDHVMKLMAKELANRHLL
jgi:hypothetical protein